MKKFFIFSGLIISVAVLNLIEAYILLGILKGHSPFIVFTHISSIIYPNFDIVATRILMAWIEELLFRAFPIFVALGLEALGIKVLKPVIIASSVIFGYLHGSVVNVFLQGVHGVLLSVEFVYIFRNASNAGTALTATTLSHALYNLLINAIVIS